MKNKEKIEKKAAWPLLGNRHIVEFLKKSIVSNKLSGSYIFLGPDNLGKTTTARFFSQILLCQNRRQASDQPCLSCPSCQKFLSLDKKKAKEEENVLHSDFYVLRKASDKKNISISQIREFIKSLSLSSMVGGYKIGIIKHSDALSQEAANALLKTLEEPRKKVIVIMIASNADRIPKTIFSRSQVFSFYPVSASIIHDYLINEHALSRSRAKNFSRLALGRPALALKFYEDEDFRELYKTRMVSFVNYFRQNINRRLESLSEVISNKEKGQFAAATSLRVLEIWQGLLRDFLLEKKGLVNIMQHEIIKTEIKTISSRLNEEKIISDMRVLDEARAHIRANVNPRSVLENVVVRIA